MAAPLSYGTFVEQAAVFSLFCGQKALKSVFFMMQYDKLYMAPGCVVLLRYNARLYSAGSTVEAFR